MASESTTPAVVAVVGETASGKSALAFELARRYDGELICADSRTIFRHMDIGTAKPTAAERTAIPHHLLDVVEPGEEFTAAQFKANANAAIADITKRGKLPILVGGTGLYIDSVLFNYQFGRQGSVVQRQEWEQLSLKDLQALITARDLEMPENEKNRRYLIRTLERESVPADDRHTLRPNTLVLGVRVSRAELRRRIEARVEYMFRKGLRKEVEELRRQYSPESEAFTGIGYREFTPYYEGKASMSEVKRQIVQHTLHLAKRQRTWFKRNPHIHWLDDPEQPYNLMDAFLGR